MMLKLKNIKNRAMQIKKQRGQVCTFYVNGNTGTFLIFKIQENQNPLHNFQDVPCTDSVALFFLK